MPEARPEAESRKPEANKEKLLMRRFAWLGVIATTLLVLACGQSDDTVTGAIRTKFAENATLKTAQVNVATEGGVVTLTGSVASQADKEQAVQIARGATGVSNVVDNLKVQEPATPVAASEPAVAGSAPSAAAEADGGAHGVGAAVGGALKTAGDATVQAGKATGAAVSDAAVATGDAAAKGGKTVGGAAKNFGVGVKDGITGGAKK